MQKIENLRTITQADHDVDTWIRHGDEAMFRGEFEKAVQMYDKAIQTRSDSAKALYSKANALETLGRYEEAVSYYDRALKCDPNDAECWFNKGIALKKLGRTDEGVLCIENGVHIAMGSG